LIRNGFYNILAAIFRLGVHFLSIPLIIKFIGVEEYGLWSLVATIIAFANLLEGGISSSIIFFLGKDMGSNDAKGASETLTITSILLLLLSALIALFLWFLSPLISSYFTSLQLGQIDSLIKASQLGGLFASFNILQRLPIAIEQVYQRYDQMNLINTLYLVANTGGLVLIVWQGGRSVQMMQWQIITNLVFFVIHSAAAWKLIKPISPKILLNKKKIYEITRYSFMAWSSTLVSALFGQGDRLIIAYFLGTRALGIYATIGNIVTQIPALASVPVQPMFPKLVSILESNSKKAKTEVVILLKKFLSLNIYVAILIGSGVLAFKDFLGGKLLPGVPVAESVPIIQIMAIVFTLYSMNIVGFNILFATKSAFECLAIQFTSTVFCLILIFIGARIGSLQLAAWGNAGYLGTLWMLVSGMQKLNIKWADWLPNLAFGISCFLILVVAGITLPQDLNFPIKEIFFVVEIVVLSLWYVRANFIHKFIFNKT
jgi:O-antigen/teichoic acid export membrane protein